MKTLVIAPCTKVKANYRCTASEMYQSRLFKLIKQFVAKKGYDWVIFSGKYGILSPDSIIDPYNETLLDSFRHSNFRKSQKYQKKLQLVREKIRAQLSEILPKYDLIIVMVGTLYQRILQPILDEINSNYEFWFKHTKGYGQICKKLKKEI